jgi:anti-sigma B factor antagonist
MLAQLIRNNPSQVYLIEIIGRIDSDNVTSVSECVEEALAAGHNQIILDLSGVEFMNSDGLRTLVNIFKRVRQVGGTLNLINPSDSVMRLLELVGLDSVLTIHFDPAWHPLGQSPNGLSSAQRQLYYLV